MPQQWGYYLEVHLSFGDARVNNRSSPEWMEVCIKAFKTDPFRKGVTIYIKVTGGDLCPVAALLGYMVVQGNHDGPMFLFSNGDYLTRDHFVAQLHCALTAAGMVCTLYAGHSFRIQDSLIKTLGRWESSAYTVYIRTPSSTLVAVLRSLAS